MYGTHPRARLDGPEGLEARTSLRTRITLPLAIALVLALPVAASASTASLQGYGTPAGTEQVAVAGATEEPGAAPDAQPTPAAADVPATARSSELPFTGLDLVLVGFVGVLLLGVGFGLRWSARTTNSSRVS
jgi:hypothetical protein